MTFFCHFGAQLVPGFRSVEAISKVFAFWFDRPTAGSKWSSFCFFIDSYEAMLIPIDLLYGYHPLWMSYEVVYEGCSAPQDFNLEGQNDNMM